LLRKRFILINAISKKAIAKHFAIIAKSNGKTIKSQNQTKNSKVDFLVCKPTAKNRPKHGKKGRFFPLFMREKTNVSRFSHGFSHGLLFP